MDIKKCLSAFAACTAALCLLSGCGISLSFNFDDSSHSVDNWGDIFSAVSVPERSYHNTSSYAVTDTNEKYDYSQKNTLDEEQTDLYNRLVVLLDDHTTAFEFENITAEDFKTAYYAVLYDHPEFFWLSQSYSYTTRTLDDRTELSIEPVLFSDDIDEIKQAAVRLDEIADRLAQEAEAQGDLFSKVKYVHDYIIDNTEYDTQAMEQVMSGRSEGIVNASTAYGCLVENKAICSGYSTAFQLIMKRLGIECGPVNGKRATETGAHQWNYVCLDGEYYYIDVTWDDPIRDDGQAAKTYEYFLISEDDLSYTHSKDSKPAVPVCSGTRYNYYRYNGTYFDWYDFDDVRAAADMFRGDSGFSVKFSSPDMLQTAVDDLITGQRIFDIDYINNGIQYSVSVSGCILNISY